MALLRNDNTEPDTDRDGLELTPEVQALTIGRDD